MDKQEVVARQTEELEVAIFNINARANGKWWIKIDGGDIGIGFHFFHFRDYLK